MSDSAKQKREARIRRHRRVRKKVRGTAERPRLAVFRSNKHISAQVIDDRSRPHARRGVDAEADLAAERHRQRRGGHARSARWWPSGPRRRASTKVVFDRGGFLYHGRVAAVADAAREAGLEF